MEHIIRSVRKQGTRFPNPSDSKSMWAGTPGQHTGCQHNPTFEIYMKNMQQNDKTWASNKIVNFLVFIFSQSDCFVLIVFGCTKYEKEKGFSAMDMNESKFRHFNQLMSDQIFLLGGSGELSKRLRSEAAEVEGWVFLHFFETCPIFWVFLHFF